MILKEKDEQFLVRFVYFEVTIVSGVVTFTFHSLA